MKLPFNGRKKSDTHHKIFDFSLKFHYYIGRAMRFTHMGRSDTCHNDVEMVICYIHIIHVIEMTIRRKTIFEFILDNLHHYHYFLPCFRLFWKLSGNNRVHFET